MSLPESLPESLANTTVAVLGGTGRRAAAWPGGSPTPDCPW